MTLLTNYWNQINNVYIKSEVLAMEPALT